MGYYNIKSVAVVGAGAAGDHAFSPLDNIWKS